MRALPSIAGATALLGLTGCMAIGPLARAGDAEVSLDAGLADGPVAPPLDIETGPVGSDASLPGSDAGALAGEADFGDDRSATCFNFIDDGGNGVLDCADPSCVSPALNTACCVASTSTACCIAEASDVERGSAACTGASSICLEVDGEQLVPTLGDVYSAASLPGLQVVVERVQNAHRQHFWRATIKAGMNDRGNVMAAHANADVGEDQRAARAQHRREIPRPAGIQQALGRRLAQVRMGALGGGLEVGNRLFGTLMILLGVTADNLRFSPQRRKDTKWSDYSLWVLVVKT